MAHHSCRILATTGAAAGLVVAGALAGTAAAQEDGAEHVTFCHEDGVGTGYDRIAPSATGAVRGHVNWDFKSHASSDNGHAEDIVPPFTYTDQDGDHAFPGQNWDAEGQAIYDNDCAVPVEEPPVKEPPVKEPPVKEPPVKEPPGEKPPGEKPPGEKPPGEKPPGEKPPGEEPPVKEPPVKEPPVKEPPVKEPPVKAAQIKAAQEPPPQRPPAQQPPVQGPPAHGTAQRPVVVHTDGFTSGGGSLFTALGVATLLGGGAAAVTIGVRTATRRD